MKKAITLFLALASIIATSAASMSMGTNSLFFFNQPEVPESLLKR